MKRQISEATREKLRAAGRKRAKQFTPEYQRATQAKRSSESLSQSGKLGYQKLVELGKEDIAAQKAAEYRLNNPTCLEVKVSEWINEIHSFSMSDSTIREVQIGKFFADFVFGNLVIEVNGKVWHENGSFIGKDVESKDRRKYQTIGEHGYSILIISEDEVKSGRGKSRVQSAVIEELKNDKQLPRF